MNKFEAIGENFVFNENNIRILSGAIHYSRVVPEYWRDRLLKLKACGFNTVETYVPWNFHEVRPGEFNFEGFADIGKFIETAGELGLFVIVRPGPYICAEWEFGGFPAWLLNIEGIQLRCYNRPYLDRVDLFYDELMPRLRPYLCTNGGPVIAMQIENEYGSYGNDKKYLEYLKDGLIRRGMDVLLFTSDGTTDLNLQGGTLEGVLKTVNFGSKPEEHFARLKKYQKDKPLMCMEYWNGWFDHWGTEHHTRNPKEVAEEVAAMLEMGASFNMYMFHGGTNFGFYNGANFNEKYLPTITSYDYDCLLSEDGEPTEKYFLVRDVLSKYVPVDYSMLPTAAKKIAYGKVELRDQAKLFENLENLSAPIEKGNVAPMEELGQSYGFILYRTNIQNNEECNELSIRGIRDRAQVFLEGDFKGVIERNKPDEKVKLDILENGAQLDILVENMGRINYGRYIYDRKGILEGVALDYQMQFGWTIYPLPLDHVEKLIFKKIESSIGPSFYRGTFYVDEIGDTFLELDGWNKGCAYINGFNIGRYWTEGPQKRLYVPGPLLKEGENEIIIFELHNAEKLEIEFFDRPSLI